VQALLLARERGRVRVDELLDAARRPQLEAREARGVAGIDAYELAAVADAERAEQPVHHAAALERRGLAAADEVHGGVEVVGAPAEGVRVAPGPVVSLDDQHRAPGAREQRGGGEAADAGADDDGVVDVVLGFGVEPQWIRSSSGSLPASPCFTMKSTNPRL
jgi:hypothetical protein